MRAYPELTSWFRRGGWLAAAVGVFIVLTAVLSFLGGPLSGPSYLLFNGGSLVALTFWWGNALSIHRRESLVGRAVAAGLIAALLATIGMVGGTIYQVLYPEAKAMPGWLAAAQFLANAVWPVALLLWPSNRQRRDAWVYVVLDVAILVLATVLLVWFYPSNETAGFLQRDLPLLGGALGLIAVSVAALRGSTPEFAIPFRLLVVSLSLTFISNFGLQAVALQGDFVNEVTAGLTVLAIFSNLGAAETLRLRLQPRRASAALAAASPIPLLAVAAIGLLVLGLGLKEKDERVGAILIGAVALTLLLLLRQSVMMRHNTRLMAEKAAYEADAKIAALVRHTSDVILIADEGYRIRFASPSVEALWAGEPSRLLGTDVRDLVDPAQRNDVDWALNDRLAHPGQSHAFRWRMQGQDSGWRQIEAVITNLVHQPLVAGIVLTLRDHTDRAELEEQLQQAQKMEAVGQLAGGIAHDFNNLLTGVLGHADLGLDTLEANHPVREDLEQIKRAAELAASLTKQLLAFSRKQMVEPRVIDVATSLDQMGLLLRRLIGERVATIVQVPTDVGRVRMDPSQLEQIVLNLAINARDAMPDGGSLTITARRERLTGGLQGAVVPVATGEYIAVEVSDTGTGMDQSTQARIFEPFFTTKPPGRGTGLGLASVYGIVRQNHAGLSVKSVVGEGSTFSVYLPRVEGQPEGLPVAHVPARTGPGTATILLVEDEPWLRDIADRVLTREGYRVMVAADAVEARALAAASPVPIDLLLTDVVMPGVSGPRLAAQLLQERPTMLVLFMSGYGGGELAAELRPEERLLRKPFTPFGLLEQVRAVLDGRDWAAAQRNELS